MPTVEPGAKRRLTCSSTSFLAFALYLNETSQKRTPPSDTDVRPSFAPVSAGLSRRTSQMRWMLVIARASSKNTLEIIIREFMMSST